MKPDTHREAQLLHSTSGSKHLQRTVLHVHMGQFAINCQIMLVFMQNDATALNIFFSEDQRCCYRCKIHTIQCKKNKIVECFLPPELLMAKSAQNLIA